ncbi:MAG: polysaccharide deacetylase family protein, partial [Micromonosporaceae bacterium]|nr:polysaccharide deacetylase family protein [Micromonosporaceae bacterium]
SLPVPVTEFRRHLEVLAEQDALVVGLTEALAAKTADSGRFVVALTFDDGYADLLNAVRVLEEFRNRATAYICPGMLVPGGPLRAAGSGLSGHLHWSELAELCGRGIEIGSHSMTHRPMDVLTADELRHEARDSKEELEQRLGVEVTSFGYPHGYDGRRVRRAVAAAGYSTACIVGRRLARLEGDRFSIPRVEAISGESPERFLLRVTAGEPGLAPSLKRLAMPAWRGYRRLVRRVTGRIIT